MIVDEKRKVLYLHNPKTGGTFLRNTYINQYGETDATKWWGVYEETYNTDLGHITYKAIPRFIPDWKDYRIYVMVRNPYNRFVSSLKETIDMKVWNVYSREIMNRKFSYIYGADFRGLSKTQQYSKWIKMMLLYTLNWNYEKSIHSLLTMDLKQLCLCLQSWSYYKQDLIIRNRRMPWLNPQADFIGERTEVLYYELPEDWKRLENAFELQGLVTNLSVQKDYELDIEIKEIIRQLYFEDWNLFDKYR
ncbi:sulfotransferase family 2 domain-containing protein [Parabacteroides bouchesdurhonensis]|uniref:sulfotransferase family 2 domain-containing protein n=1 Tax=Parabacteroides bouchesdurhonensis TaxID=1936995 RepID=UPI000C820B0D|nr:sulfotransferase family 2 domain-containing protein [Parabacteroides bouchesdurhonensis]